MAFSVSRNLISFIGIGNRPSTSPSFSCSNEVPTVGSLLGRAPQRRNLRRTGLPGLLSIVSALERSNSGGDRSNGKNGGGSNSNVVVPLDKSFPLSDPSCITRPLAEILSDLNKKIPDNFVKADVHGTPLSPGWFGEVRDVIFSNNGRVTVLYGITVYGSDGKNVSRIATGTVYPSDGHIGDPVATAEELALCKACAQLGLGLYLYHED